MNPVQPLECSRRDRRTVARRACWSGVAIWSLLCASAASVQADTERGINAQRLALIVNDADAYSVATANYYVARRGIPLRNVIHVRFAPRSAISAAEFEQIRTQVAARTSTDVQAYALAWVEPYRVDCMSITTAFAMGGFDGSFCAAPCSLTRRSAYYNAHTRVPANSLGIFPTMSIAAPTVEQAKGLIDRGVTSDGTFPAATAYLVSSDDFARNGRARHYQAARTLDLAPIKLAFVHIDEMHNRNDVLFYFVGARVVEDMNSNRFLPGAVADHLTSTGGDLLHTRQMSSLRWIAAGATGSYGSVVEPCAFVEKFPDPVVFMRFYRAGETLIEAYWKSVAMPGQGIFIGEPLARPFAGDRGVAQ